MQNDFQTNLERYAELAIKVWLNVQPGQRVSIRAPIETAQLVRLATKLAYQVGSPFVEYSWTDDALTRIRYEYAPRDSYDEYSIGFFESLKASVERGDALLWISGQDPDLLKGLDQDFISRTSKSTAARFNPLTDRIQRNEATWLALGMPILSWAARVFPDSPPQEQMEKLWDAIFRVCRIYEPDPIAAWQRHIDELGARSSFMNSVKYAALHYSAPGTDLMVYLPPGHLWVGAGETNARGILFYPNIPTEEIFTAPDRNQTEGVVTTTKPLVVQGTVIDRFTLTFENGRVVRIEASNGHEVLEKLIATDEGAARLGEVALVPNSNPISNLGITFYNALFDENAASHFALGSAYPSSLIGGAKLTAEELNKQGINNSLVHLDFMVGSAEMNIDGVRADGTRQTVMRNGEWAFKV